MKVIGGKSVALVRLCMIDSTKQKSSQDDNVSVDLVGHFSNRLSMASVRTEQHNGYVTERV